MTPQHRTGGFEVFNNFLGNFGFQCLRLLLFLGSFCLSTKHHATQTSTVRISKADDPSRQCQRATDKTRTCPSPIFYNMDRSLLDTKFRYKVEFSTRLKISGTDGSKNSSRFGQSFCANLSGSFFCLN